jgi:signal transduction histidine kinase
MSFAAFLIYFAMAVYVAVGRIEIKQKIRLTVLSAMFAIAALERMVVHNNCASLELVQKTELFTRYAWIAVSPIGFMVALSLTRFEKYADSLVLNILIFFYIAAIYMIDALGYTHGVEKVDYGWLITMPGRFSALYNICDYFFTFGGVLLLLHGVVYSRNRATQVQSGIILVFAGAAVLGLNIAQIINSRSFIADSADIFDLLLVAGAVIAISEYGFASLTAAFASESIFRNASEMMILTDINGVILEANRAFTEKEASGIAKGKNIGSILDTDGAASMIGRIISDGRIEGREVKLAGGGVGLLTASLLKTGGIDSGIAFVITDISQLKKMQEDMKSSYDRLVLLDSMKTSLTHSLTHDLRTPMVSIKGFVSVLLKNGVGPLNDMQKDMLETVSRNVERQLRLINEMLEAARLQGGGLSLDTKELDVAETVKGALREITGAASGKNIRLVFNRDTGVLKASADEFRIWQVLENLLGNAVKFSNEGSTVYVEVKKSGLSESAVPPYAETGRLKNADYILVSITDSGGGIAREDLSRIFEKYVQAESSQKKQGTGLGLSIAKGIIEAHGGAIWAESAGPGLGSTFKFIIPAV